MLACLYFFFLPSPHNNPLRASEASFLLYSILDAVVDNYFPITAFWGGRLETIEKEMLVATNENHLKCARVCHMTWG